MIAADLLNRLNAVGVNVRVDGHELVLSPRDRIDDDLAATVREYGRPIRILLERRELERNGRFSLDGQVCARCQRIGRVAFIDGERVCGFCVIDAAETAVAARSAR